MSACMHACVEALSSTMSGVTQLIHIHTSLEWSAQVCLMVRARSGPGAEFGMHTHCSRALSVCSGGGAGLRERKRE